MKTKLLSMFAVLLLSGCCTWCLPQEALDTAKQNAELTDGFVTLIENGQTTRENEQNFIRSNRRAWHAQNNALNDVPLPADVAAWYRENQPDNGGE
jgi:hypothetical protein